MMRSIRPVYSYVHRAEGEASLFNGERRELIVSPPFADKCSKEGVPKQRTGGGARADSDVHKREKEFRSNYPTLLNSGT